MFKIASKAVYYDNGAECPTFCPLIYQPICGFDGTTNHTYPNECSMKVASCEDKKSKYCQNNCAVCFQSDLSAKLKILS